jgi:molecular chaperone HscB
MNYFELLEIDEKYTIDLKLLNDKYLFQQSKYHPDRARNSQQKKDYQDISVQLNKAFAVLKDDLKRAEYFLELEGLSITDEEARGKISNDKLLEIWEQREIVENTNEILELEELYNLKIAEKNVLISELNNLFDNKKLQDALDITISFKYLTNLLESIKLKIKNANNRD